MRAISFTLALQLPGAGSGLRVWPIRPRQLHSRSALKGEDEPLRAYLARKPSVYVPYAPGRVYLQREPLLHCICNGSEIIDTDQRITLQGHGLDQEGEFVLYW